MESLRANVREFGRQERIKHRELSYDQSRGALGETEETKRISPEQVRQMTVDMKRKSHVTLDKLTFLQKAFIQHESNIHAFLDVTGALNIIIKELSGQNASLQLGAANCCCNLALGNAKHCLLVTKATAPYLISHLQGANLQLVDVCAWSLGNLSAGGDKSWLILRDQGAVQKLTVLLSSADSNVRGSAVYALSHMVKVGCRDLPSSELLSLASASCPLLEDSTIPWLLFLLSCHSECDDVFMTHNIASRSLSLLSQTDNLTHKTALLRVLANLCSEPSGQAAMSLLQDSRLSAVLRLLLDSQPHQAHIVREIVWLVGNVAKHSSSDVRTRFIASGLKEQLESRLAKIMTF